MEEIMKKIKEEQKIFTIYPPMEYMFRAIELCPITEVKVVIIGQDPYHGAGQANGLAFSVNEGVSIPPTIRNIIKELKDDVGKVEDSVMKGDLTLWARRGVLLLNNVLSVREGRANSHSKIIGWEKYTDDLIRQINRVRGGVVFILWGNNAKSKAYLIDDNKHKIISSVHPSPLSASRGFFGSKPFSKANKYLEEKIF